MKEGIWKANPLTFHILGICSALAITSQVKTAIVMSLSVIFVLVLSNGIISLMRNMIPAKVRIIIELTVIALLVIIADQLLKAFLYDVSRMLSVYVGLIITNCIILGRAEAFALQNPPVSSMFDGLGNGLGYALILCSIGVFREIFGSGSLLGFQIVPEGFYQAGYANMGLMVMAPGAFILMGLLVWLQRTISPQEEK